MEICNVNEQNSSWGAAFRNKPIFFMSVKETEAYFDGKLRKNMELREDTCTLGSNNTYRRPHTTYEAYDTGKGCQRYLKGVTGTDISLEDLYMMLDEKIDGLPKKADNLINNTKNNAKAEQMRGRTGWAADPAIFRQYVFRYV